MYIKSIIFEQILSKKLKLSVLAEMLYKDIFKYAEFDYDFLLFVCLFVCLSSEIPILGEFGPKTQNCHFNLKFVT